MSQKGRFKHLAKALQQSHYLSSEISPPENITGEILKALEKFLLSKKGKDVRRVVNAFRSIKTRSFLNIGNTDHITPAVREATQIFIDKYSKVTCLQKPEIEQMKPWEIQGPQSKSPEIIAS